MKTIRYLLFTLFAAAACAPLSPLFAQQGAVGFDRVTVAPDGSRMKVGMELDLRALDVPSNRAVVLTPRLVNGADSLCLQSVGIYGRRRYFYYERNGLGALGTEGDLVLRASKLGGEPVSYRAEVPYAEWMNGARLVVRRSDCGCCQRVLAQEETILGGYRKVVYAPHFVYVRPEAEAVKERHLEGRAFIDFPVNRTEIRPDYRGNRQELAKIRATIDSVRNDADITVKSLSIKGFASPEGSWASNARLAEGRTGALKRYVSDYYHFAPDFIAVSWEPEDWEGLRRFVEASELEHRAEILAIIDAGGDPDARERKIRAAYPAEYRYLLDNCYPALRHSDYRIDYVIRSYTDAGEIRRLIRTRPQRLSLAEFFFAAQQMEPGSEEFNGAFETCVRMYPGDPTANLNAANAAMAKGDLKSAAAYLARAGATPEAVYARGVCATLGKDYEAAEPLFREAAAGGVAEAAEALAQLAELKTQP